VNALTNPVFIGSADGQFSTHAIPFVFGPGELAGLQLFLAEPGPRQPPPPGTPPPGGVGNCVACHAPPAFTDFRFHNTGVSQLEYDSIFGPGAFAQLKIPTLTERKKTAVNTLPPSAQHPGNKGTFRSVPSVDQPGQADLGMWNVYANPDIPGPQATLKKLLAVQFGKLKPDALLDKTIATFKTPGLRDLLDSQPFLHDGSRDNIGEVVHFYVQVAQMARDGLIRNADPELAKIALTPEQTQQLTMFLNALNDDFQD
jgi:cytochrome c peroxidase